MSREHLNVLLLAITVIACLVVAAVAAVSSINNSWGRDKKEPNHGLNILGIVAAVGGTIALILLSRIPH